MRKNLFLSILLISTLTFMSACGDKNVFITSSVGAPYDIVVVSGDKMWENPSGRALYDVLDADVPALPQSEAAFKISHVNPESFGRLMRTYRNIIRVDISTTYTQTKMKFIRNEYASPQMTLIIQSPNEADFEKFVTANAQRITGFFTSAEMNREMDELKEKHSITVLDTVKALFDCELLVPYEINGLKVRDNFLWASNTYSENGSIKNFVIYSYPYTDADTFTKDYFIRKRDSVMAANVPGAKEGQHVMTDTLLLDVKDASLRNGTLYMQEVRGLWKMKNGFMGGPFVSHGVVDELNGRVIVVETFVFAPEQKKRNLIRGLEAALYTLKLPADKEIELSTQIPEVVIEQEEAK